MHAHAGDVLADHLALACVNAGSELDAQCFGRRVQRPGALDRARRAIERREEAVSGRLHRATALVVDLLSRKLVVALKQTPPAPVAKLGCPRG